MAQTETTKRHKPSINGHGAYRPQTVWITKPTEIENMTAQKVKIPARPAKTKPLPEDHSTPYKPPSPVSLVASHVMDKITIVDDAPIYKHSDPYRYHEIFDRLTVGKALRVPNADVSKVCGAMRKWINLRGRENDVHVKSTLDYCNDKSYGRIWLMPGKSLAPIRKRSNSNIQCPAVGSVQ